MKESGSWDCERGRVRVRIYRSECRSCLIFSVLLKAMLFEIAQLAAQQGYSTWTMACKLFWDLENLVTLPVTLNCHQEWCFELNVVQGMNVTSEFQMQVFQDGQWPSSAQPLRRRKCLQSERRLLWNNVCTMKAHQIFYPFFFSPCATSFSLALVNHAVLVYFTVVSLTNISCLLPPLSLAHWPHGCSVLYSLL